MPTIQNLMQSDFMQDRPFWSMSPMEWFEQGSRPFRTTAARKEMCRMKCIAAKRQMEEEKSMKEKTIESLQKQITELERLKAASTTTEEMVAALQIFGVEGLREGWSRTCRFKGVDGVEGFGCLGVEGSSWV